MRRNNSLKYSLALIFVVLIGFFLRLWGIKYGLPNISHPDELRVILDTLSMGHRFSLIPARPDYSLLYRYLLLGLYGFYFLFGKLVGSFKDTGDFALKFLIDPSNLYIITRMVSVIFGTLTGVFVYILTKRFFGKMVAFASLVFVLFEFQLLQHSQWGIYPSAFAFTTLPAFYFMFAAIKEPSLRNFILMGVFTGISISTQNHGIFLLPSLTVTVLISFLDTKDKIPFKTFFRYAVALALSIFVFSLLGNFYWLFIFKKAMLKYAELLGVTKVGFASKAPYANNIFSMALWFFKELIRQDFILGIILVSGIFYSLHKHTKLDIIFLMYVIVNLFILSNWGFRLLHDMLGVMPIICIFGGRFIVDVVKKLKLKDVSIGIISCLIVSPLAYDSIIVNIKKNNPDTRQLAKIWIEENISPTERIAIDWHVFNVPLNNEIPLYFRNPVARKYYDEKIPRQIKERYNEYLRGKKVYEIIEVMSPLDEPLWPIDMPAEAIEEASKHKVYKDLYSKFHFIPLEQLKKNRIRYLIISSYLYGFFLLDSDLNKKDLFNPYIKDRIWLNFSQADHYINDYRYGLLYFLSRDARNFYLPLLNNKFEDITLVREFRPDNLHLGPVIKIYKIEWSNLP